jgi:hypothetical protein
MDEIGIPVTITRRSRLGGRKPTSLSERRLTAMSFVMSSDQEPVLALFVCSVGPNGYIVPIEAPRLAAVFRRAGELSIGPGVMGAARGVAVSHRLRCTAGVVHFPQQSLVRRFFS